MPKKVPYLREEQIERDAAALLTEYAQVRNVVIAPPIPIEDIVEKHLKLGIEFDDMHRLLRVPRSGLGLDPDILGAIWFDDRRIVIDESLDPEENPSKEGRYRFTPGARGRRALAAAPSPVRQGPGTGLLVQRAGPALGRLPFEPSERTRRMAGGFLCVMPADAAQAGHGRMGSRCSRTVSPECYDLRNRYGTHMLKLSG